MTTKTTPYWLVWMEGGGPPTVHHDTQSDAETEAERLAKQFPGRRFVVLVPIARFTEQRVTIERFEVDDDSVPF